MRIRKLSLLVAIMLLVFPTNATDVLAKRIAGKATVYADKYHGRKTASGDRYNKRAMTAASPYLPFGTRVRVRNKRNGRSAVVRINDRMARGGAILDLSRAAARKLGIKGTAPVTGHTFK